MRKVNVYVKRITNSRSIRLHDKTIRENLILLSLVMMTIVGMKDQAYASFRTRV